MHSKTQLSPDHEATYSLSGRVVAQRDGEIFQKRPTQRSIFSQVLALPRRSPVRRTHHTQIYPELKAFTDPQHSPSVHAFLDLATIESVLGAKQRLGRQQQAVADASGKPWALTDGAKVTDQMRLTQLTQLARVVVVTRVVISDQVTCKALE